MSRFSDLLAGKQSAPTPEVLAEVIPNSVVEETAPEPEVLMEQHSSVRKKKKRNSSGF